MQDRPQHIMLIENDPEIRDLITGQFLDSQEFQVVVAPTAMRALQEISEFSPLIIIANVINPDLNAKDIVIALAAQGIEIPMLVYAHKGMEGEILQAIRAGAVGFFQLPPREAEIALVLRRALKLVGAGEEQARLASDLDQANRELEEIRLDFAALLTLKDAFYSVQTRAELASKALEAAMYFTHAASGWMLLREENEKAFHLSAHRAIPQILVDRLSHNWDDGLASIAIFSAETIHARGKTLDQSIISQYGTAALLCPVKIGSQMAGLMVLVNRSPDEFSPTQQRLLEMVSIITSMAYLNLAGFPA